MVNFIVWIIFGALAGWVVSLVTASDKNRGAATNIIVGVFGAFIGGFIARNLGAQGITGFNTMSFLSALACAVLLILIVRMVA